MRYVVDLVGEGMTLAAVRRVLELEAQVRALEAERDALREAVAQLGRDRAPPGAALGAAAGTVNR